MRWLEKKITLGRKSTVQSDRYKISIARFLLKRGRGRKKEVSVIGILRYLQSLLEVSSSFRRGRALVWGGKERKGWSMFMAFHIEEYQKGKGKSRVSDIRRGDHKHKGIYIQIFKHS